MLFSITLKFLWSEMESRTMRIRTTALHVVITVSNMWNLMMLIHLLLKETGLFLLHKNYITVFLCIGYGANLRPRKALGANLI